MPTSKLEVEVADGVIHANKKVVFTLEEAISEVSKLTEAAKKANRQLTDIKAMPIKLKNAEYLKFEKNMETYNIRQQIGGDIEARMKGLEADIVAYEEATGKFLTAINALPKPEPKAPEKTEAVK